MYAFAILVYQVLFRIEPFQDHYLTKAGTFFIFIFEVNEIYFYSYFEFFNQTSTGAKTNETRYSSAAKRNDSERFDNIDGRMLGGNSR